MDAAKQRETFDKLTSRAKTAGLLKFCQDGLAVIEIPPAVSAPAVAPESALPAVSAVPVASGQ